MTTGKWKNNRCTVTLCLWESNSSNLLSDGKVEPMADQVEPMECSHICTVVLYSGMLKSSTVPVLKAIKL